tara:strand:+ start:167 stop:394 length:228 start_codon:yes stop_codon:yes gene_type:complete
MKTFKSFRTSKTTLKKEIKRNDDLEKQQMYMQLKHKNQQLLRNIKLLQRSSAELADRNDVLDVPKHLQKRIQNEN